MLQHMAKIPCVPVRGGYYHALRFGSEIVTALTQPGGRSAAADPAVHVPQLCCCVGDKSEASQG